LRLHTHLLTTALLSLLTTQSLFSEDFKFSYTGKELRYETFKLIAKNRWQNSTIEWWYNPTNQPFTTQESLNAIKSAMETWEATGRIKYIYKGETEQTLSNQSDDKFIIGWLDQATFQERFGSYAGYTHIWWNGTNVFDGEISLNEGSWQNGTLSDFIGLMTHELGHSFGVDHSDVRESIMYARPYHTYEYQKTLRDDDLSAIAFLYPQVQFASSETNITVVSDSTNNSNGLITKDVIEAKQSGWHLLGSGQKVSDYTIFNSAKSVWNYKNSNWKQYTPGVENSAFIIEAYDGFWIYK